MNKQVKFIDLGLMDYKDAWDYQQTLFDEIVEIKKKNRKNNTKSITPNYFLFVDYPAIFKGIFNDIVNCLKTSYKSHNSTLIASTYSRFRV